MDNSKTATWTTAVSHWTGIKKVIRKSSESYRNVIGIYYDLFVQGPDNPRHFFSGDLWRHHLEQDMFRTPDRNFNNLGVQNWGTLGFTYQYLCLRNLFRFVQNVWYQSLDPAFSAFPGINPFKISLGTFGFTYQRLCLRNFSRWGKNVSHQSFDNRKACFPTMLFLRFHCQG